MKIVFLSGLYPPQTKGGGEISTALIAEGLKQRGHDVQVVTGKDIPELLEKPLFEMRHSKQIAASLPRVLAFPAPPSGAHETLRARWGTPGAPPAADDDTIYHAHDFRSALALSELGLPNMVVTARDYAQVCGTTNNLLSDGSRCTCTLRDIRQTQRYREVGWPRRWARAWQYWHNLAYRVRAFEKFENEIFISRAQKEEVETHPVRAKFGTRQELPQHTAVIYNPVAPKYLSTPAADGQAGLVLYVGRVEDYKGVRLLLEAWEQVAKALPHAHLKIVGEGPQKQEYERWVEARGLQYRVTFAGKLPYERLRRAYDEASVVVAPHIWLEPFGRTVAEAAARGKVVVTARAGGPAEIIQHGVSGLLFERGSAQALEAQLKTALTLRPYDYGNMSRAARTWAKDNLSVEVIAQQYEEFYNNLSTAERT